MKRKLICVEKLLKYIIKSVVCGKCGQAVDVKMKARLKCFSNSDDQSFNWYNSGRL